MWREALKLLLSSSATSSARGQQQQHQQHQAAAAEVSTWMREHSSSFPSLTARAAAALSSRCPSGQQRLPPDLRKAILDIAISPVSPPEQVQSIVEGLGMSPPATIHATQRSAPANAAAERLTLLSALSRTQQLPKAREKKKPAAAAAAADALVPTSTAVAETLFQTLLAANDHGSKSDSSSAAVRNATDALYARCIAPNALKGGQAGAGAPLLVDGLSPQYRDFLKSVRQNALLASKTQKEGDIIREDEIIEENLQQLKTAFDALPEKRPLNSVYVRCLIGHRRWATALSLLESSSSLSSSSTFANAQISGAVAGLKLAAGQWESALEIVATTAAACAGDDSAQQVWISTVRRLSQLTAQRRLESVPRKFFSAAISDLVERNSSQRAVGNEGIVVAATTEAAMNRAGADRALALTLSSNWKHALRDFSMLLTLANSTDSNSSAAEIARNALLSSKAARRRVVNAAADGNRADVLQMVLRLLQPSSSFSPKEAAALAYRIAIQNQNSRLLVRLREVWPSEAAARAAIRLELGVAAKRVVCSYQAGKQRQQQFGIPLSTEAEKSMVKHFLAVAVMSCHGGGILPAGVRSALFQIGMRVQATGSDDLSQWLPPPTPSLRPAIAMLERVFQREKILRTLRRDVMRRAAMAMTDVERDALLSDLCAAQFPKRHYAAAMKRMEKLIAAASAGSREKKKQQQQVVRRGRQQQVSWNMLANEVIRVGDELASDFLRVVRHSVPLTTFSKDGVGQNLSSSSSSSSVCGGLLQILQQRTSSAARNPLSKRDAEVLGRCIIRILTVAPQETLKLAASAADVPLNVRLSRQQQQLATLVRVAPFPAAPAAVETRARILSVAGQQLSAAAAAAAEGSVSGQQSARGWVRGAGDVLDLASTAPLTTRTTVMTVPTHVASASSLPLRQNQQQQLWVTWLLQQSSECRDFVRDEVKRVLAERQQRKLPRLAPQTVQAELWRHMGRMFSSAAAVLMAAEHEGDEGREDTSAAAAAAAVKASAALTISEFVGACAAILKEGRASNDLDVCSSVSAFCFRHGLAGNSVMQSNDVHATFVAGACHVDDEQIRNELVELLRRHCCCSSQQHASTSHQSAKVDGTTLPQLGSECLWERWRLLAAAEGGTPENQQQS